MWHKYKHLPATLVKQEIAKVTLSRNDPYRPGRIAKRLDAVLEAESSHQKGNSGDAVVQALSPLDLLWQQVLELLGPVVTTADYSTWLEPTRLMAVVDDNAIVGVPNVFARDMLMQEYIDLLTAALACVLGRKPNIEVVIDNQT